MSDLAPPSNPSSSRRVNAGFLQAGLSMGDAVSRFNDILEGDSGLISPQ